MFLYTFYRRSLWLIRAIVLFFGVSFVALVIALSQVNLESLRGNILSVLRDTTNLPVEIDGAISWSFSLKPEIKLHSVRVPNADWAKNKNLFFADKIAVRLDLFSLFRSRPAIRNIKFYDAKVFLEKNEKGEDSIVFYNQEENVKKEENNNKKSMPKYPVNKMPFGGIEFQNLNANIYGEKYKVNSFSIRNYKKKGSLEFSGWFRPENNTIPFVIDFAEYNAERKIYPLKIAISTGGDALIANIALEGTSKMPIDFIIRGDLPNIKKSGNLFDINMKKSTNIKLNLVGGVDRKQINLRKSSISSGESSIVFSGGYNWSGNVPVVTADITSDYFDLYKSFPELFAGNKKHPDRELNVFKDIPLFGEYLYNTDVKLNLKWKDFVMYRSLDLADLIVDLQIKNNKARADISTEFAGGNINVALEADIQQDGVFNLQTAIRGEHIYIGDILKEIYINNVISKLPMNINAYYQSSGKDLSQLMQKLTGHTLVYSVDPGYAHADLVEYMYGGDFLTNLRHNVEDIFTGKKRDMIEISKAVANVKIRDGLIETQNGVVAETHVVNVRLVGDLDLGKETINLSLASVPVRGLKLSLSGNLVNAIQISGNLAEPDFSISSTAIAGKVGSAVGLGLLLAPLSGGLSIAGGFVAGFFAGDLLESWLADDHPYDTAMKDGAPNKNNDPRWLNMPIEILSQPLLQRKND